MDKNKPLSVARSAPHIHNLIHFLRGRGVSLPERIWTCDAFHLNNESQMLISVHLTEAENDPDKVDGMREKKHSHQTVWLAIPLEAVTVYTRHP